MSCSGPTIVLPPCGWDISFERWDPRDPFSFTLRAPGTLGTKTHFRTILHRPEAKRATWTGAGLSRVEGSLGRLGLQLYLGDPLWTPLLEFHPQIITFPVLGELNRIFIEKWTLLSP